MSSVQEKFSRHHKYHVVKVEKTDPPTGSGGGKWYRYVIERGGAVLTGQKPGSRQEVAAYAEQYAADLNERLGNVRGGYYYARYRIKN
ncbi:MAG TPA: hypothetical protein VKA64_00625 [Gammaproteobacteria bacterium]|nr:hypothetical protein [Gammaproteobacteria bacterium]